MKWNAVHDLISNQRGRLNNLAVLLSANAITAGLGIITTIAVANRLGSARFGELAYAYAVGGIIAVNVRFGMDRSLIRYLVHYPQRFGEFVAASLLLRVAFLLTSWLGLFVLISVARDAVELSTGMLLVVLATTLLPLQIGNVFDVWEKQGRHAAYMLAQRLLYFGLIWGVILWAPERLSIAWIGSALLVSSVFFMFLQYVYAWKRLRREVLDLSWQRVLGTSRELARGNGWLWLANLAALGLTAMNKVVLKQTCGFSTLGVYAASWQLASLANILSRNVARIGRPSMARRTDPRTAKAAGMPRFMMQFQLIMLGTVSAVALPAIIFPEWILDTLFSHEYASGYLVLRIFGVCILIRAIEIVFGLFVVFTKMDNVYFLANVLGGAVSIALCVTLVPAHGGVGAALGVLTGTTLSSIMLVVASTVRVVQLQRSDSGFADSPEAATG